MIRSQAEVQCIAQEIRFHANSSGYYQKFRNILGNVRASSDMIGSQA